MAVDGETNTTHRFGDVAKEPCITMTPIEGFNKKPLVSLEEATKPLRKIVPRIDIYVSVAKARVVEHFGQKPPNGLSIDESAAIHLYTTEWGPYYESLYYILNNTLRTEDRKQLVPWFLYLKLVLTALSRLPQEKYTIYRGVKSEIVGADEKYQIGKEIIWWGFSSCSRKRNISEKDQFLGENGEGTLFVIECIKGKDISKHSYFKKEKEVLLLPATKLRVTSREVGENGTKIIYLQEIEPLHCLLESVSTEDELKAKRQASPQISPKLTAVRSQPEESREQRTPASDERYFNPRLSEHIARCKPDSEVYLIGRQFTEKDMEIIVQELIIGRRCRELFLRESGITSPGAIVIANALAGNKTLERLFMSYNNIGDDGAVALAEALKKNTTLKHLCLGYNSITDSGAESLAEALKVNRTLTHLWLPSNKISDRGLQKLADVLTNTNKSLQVLSLEWNKFSSDPSVATLVQMLTQNQALTLLNLNNCKFPRPAISTLKGAIKKKKNFELLIH